jgi:hypothetical protein
MLDPSRFSRDVLASLPAEERSARLRKMETAASAELQDAATLAEFQERLSHLSG